MLTPEGYAKSETEHAQQVALFMWAGMLATQWPALELLYAIPNGGLRNKATAAMLKAEGVKSGFPDVGLPVPRHGYAGCFIEMKKPKGKTAAGSLSPDQRDFWHPRLTQEGYYVTVCYSYEDARKCLCWYLGIPE